MHAIGAKFWCGPVPFLMLTRGVTHSLNSMNALCINCEIERIPLHRLLDASIALLHYVANKQHLALFRTVREFKCCHLFIYLFIYYDGTLLKIER